jgi:hypothetical protein
MLWALRNKIDHAAGTAPMLTELGARLDTSSVSAAIKDGEHHSA